NFPICSRGLPFRERTNPGWSRCSIPERSYSMRTARDVSRVCEELTAREHEVLALLTPGHTNKEIANLLCISEATVESHLHHIYRKLRVKRRTQAAVYALSRS